MNHQNNIGIVTFSKSHNIGAFLQSFALSYLLMQYGYTVKFVKPDNQEYEGVVFRNDMGTWRNLRPWNAIFLAKKYYKFNKCFKTFSYISESDISDVNFKCIVLGSDSIWIPTISNFTTPNIFFGDLNNKNIISYAASTGGIEDISKYTKQQLSALSKITSITVRDSTTQKFIRQITGKDSMIVADPTLLVDWEQILISQNINYSPEKDRYVMLYGGFTVDEMKQIVDFAHKNNMIAVSVGTFERRADKNISVSPFEFVNYILHAEYIYTSMFHGVMLSIGLKKKFKYLSKDVHRDKKLETTLNYFGLREHIWDKDKKIDYWPYNINMDNYYRIGCNWIDKSREYLLNCVSKCTKVNL